MVSTRRVSPTAKDVRNDDGEFEEEAYRIALALNNMAITLMQRGCYGSALKTMGDCLSTFKMIFPVNQEEDNEDDEGKRLQSTSSRRRTALSKPKDYLKKGSQRCFRSLKVDKCGTASTACASFMYGLVQVEPVDDEDLNSLRSAALYGPNSTIVFPVRISSEPCHNSNHHQQQYQEVMARHFATILYNHGLAHYLVSRKNDASGKASSSSPSGERLEKRAYKSMRLSETIFMGRLEAMEEAAAQGMGNDDDEQVFLGPEYSLSMLSAIVLNGLTLIYQAQGLHRQAEEAQHEVSFLCSTVDDDILSTFFLQKHTAAAA